MNMKTMIRNGRALIKDENGNAGYVSVFQFNDIYHEEGIDDGLVILFTIINSRQFKIDELVINYTTANGDETGDVYTSDSFKDEFKTLSSFCLKYNQKDLNGWKIQLSKGDNISGKDHSSVSIITQEKFNYLRQLVMIESESYEYHTYPVHLISYLCHRENISTRLAVQSLQKLSKQNDLYQEFAKCIQNNDYIPPCNGIEVEGYNAVRLINEVGLHPIGAYQSLVHLREDRKTALKNINRGIIRK